MRNLISSCSILGLAAVLVMPAAAQEAEIVVSARKRDETAISVPVVVSAVSSAELDRRGVTNLDGIARIVPQLIIAPQGGSIQGGNIALRGIAGPDSNPFGDQAVSFNVDGVQIAKATVRRMSEIDIAQIEVLKGPQALFFGKNSPAGIVSIRTADPTDELEAKLTAGYEFEAREIRVEGYVSAPINENLGFRIAGYASDLNGYLKNSIPSDAYVAPTSERRTPHSRDYAVRGTLKWDPTDAFDARLKINYGRTRNSGPAATTQYIDCPFGAPQSGSIDACRADKYTMNPGSGPVVGTLDPAFRDGRNYSEQDQVLASLEMNYKLSDEVTLTSVSGLYWVKLRQAHNFQNDYSVALPSANRYRDRQLSQELRIQTGYDGPLNFTAGVYYSRSNAKNGSHTYLFATEDEGLAVLEGQGLGFIPLRTPFQINNYLVQQKGEAYSAFMQLSYLPVRTVEINVGGRYSYEKKRLPFFWDGGSGANPFGGNPLTAADAIVTPVDRGNWNDFSPEVTISYRPTSDLTLFGSYKHGFLSGGFNSAAGVTGDLSYDPQTIKGFEGGVKARLLNGDLRTNLALYSYEVSDLQVSVDRNTINSIRNAAASKVKGVEFDFTYRAPLDGLMFRGSAAYNDASYSDFTDAPCYPGQTIGLGCAINALGDPVQNLAGAPLPRAPKWSLSGGIGYDAPLSSTLKLGLSVDVNYNSAAFTDLTNDPRGRMPKYALLDGTIRLGEVDDMWQLALIGRNLTNKYYYAASTQVPFTGSVPGGVTGTLGDRYASVSRGREIMFRISYTFATK